VDQRALVVIRC